MNKIILQAGSLALIDGNPEPAAVAIENGRIAAIGGHDQAADAAETIDLGGLTLYPGFIDAHNHGAVGVDVNEATVEDLHKVGAFLASRGVTAWLPTFVPDSDETYRRVTGEIEKLLAVQDGLPIAQIVGVHYEGVFANTQMCGALRPEYFKSFTGGELAELPTLSQGAHVTTFAPEIEGGVELVRELKRRNWIPSIGHTRADFATLEAAFEAGARRVTHLFNAMTGLHHRDVGVVGWALGKREVSCEIIADGIHVAPPVLKLALDAKTAGGLTLVSDSVAPTGLGDGEFALWGEKIKVTSGRTENERGSIAGSVISMLDAVRSYLALGVPAAEIAQIASANPARDLGLDAERGSIEAGKRADLVALDAEGRVRLVLIAGQVAFREL